MNLRYALSALRHASFWGFFVTFLSIFGFFIRSTGIRVRLVLSLKNLIISVNYPNIAQLQSHGKKIAFINTGESCIIRPEDVPRMKRSGGVGCGLLRITYWIVTKRTCSEKEMSFSCE
jgi:hypothetical protein